MATAHSLIYTSAFTIIFKCQPPRKPIAAAMISLGAMLDDDDISLQWRF